MPKKGPIGPKLRGNLGLRCKVRGCKQIAPGARLSGMCRKHAQRKQLRGHAEQEAITIGEIRRSGEPLFSLLQQGVKTRRADVTSLERFNAILKERHATQLAFFNDVASGRHDQYAKNKYAVQAAERLAYAFKRLPPDKALLHLLGVMYLATQGRFKSQTAADFACFYAVTRHARETKYSYLHLNPFPEGARWIPRPEYVACYYNARCFGGKWLRNYVVPFASIAFKLDKLTFTRKQADALATLFAPGIAKAEKKLKRSQRRLEEAQKDSAQEAHCAGEAPTQ